MPGTIQQGITAMKKKHSVDSENLAKKLKFGDAKSIAPNNLKLKRIQFILCFWIISLSNKS